MSHFCTLVFCKNRADVEHLLAPYQEYDGQDGFPKEWLSFVASGDFDVDKETGKRGYWDNPNAIWDWYTEGGRYRKSFRLKNGDYATSAKVSEFDFSLTEREKKRYSREWEIGVNGAERTEEEKRDLIYTKEYYLSQWGTKEEFMYEMCNSHGFFFITPDGKLHKKGEGLWFGMSTATRESRKKYVEEWQETIKTISPDYYMVVVDCHI